MACSRVGLANRPAQAKEERRQQLEDHVQNVNKMLREAQHAGTEINAEDGSDGEWGGIPDGEIAEEPPLDREEEYIDEDRYTTVTIAAVNIDRDGIHKPGEGDEEEGDGDDDSREKQATAGTDGKQLGQSRKDQPKIRKKKFRYETKHERRLTERKQKAKKSR